MFTQHPHWAAHPAQAAIVGSEPRKERTTVTSTDNHVYFYAKVESETGMELMRELREKDRELRVERLARDLEDTSITPIWLHIYSFGGDVFTGLSLADQIAALKTPVYSIVEGVCASAATLVSVACVRRFILPSSFMLIHQLSSFVYGTHEEFKDEMSLQQMIMQRFTRFYTGKTRVEKDALKQMLMRDFWMDAKTCLKLGFVDEILE